MRRWIQLTGILLTILCPPAGASAHEGRHAFESVIAGPFPERLATGIDLRVIDWDERVELVNRSGRTVVVHGVAGEPYLRIESRGPVFMNVRSPAAPLNNDRWGRTRPSGREDASAPPAWVRVGEGGRFVWFEHRAQYRPAGVPPQVTDRAEPMRIRDYRIPLTVGGEPAEIRGTLNWVGYRPFPNVAFVTLLLASAAVALFGAVTLGRLRNLPDRPATDP